MAARAGRGRGRRPLVVIAAGAAVLLALAHSDEIRVRAEAALGKGMPAREAALARGFVLGQDDRVDARTEEDFRRSGLSHLLAVSGQNVALLCLLAMPLLAALGMPLGTRLVWLIGLIAVYVPLAGADPSIQRAAIMGGLSLLATLAGRRASRLYALALAAVVLLALDPGVAADVGWQLSFAAVLGILLFAAPLRAGIVARLSPPRWCRPLADGAAMTVAATLATAPLIAFHFEAVSVATLAANLLALPAVAPVMWLGMLSAAAGQVPGAPVEAVNALAAPLLAYIAQVAAWCGRPGWAYPHVRLSLGGLLASYAALGLAGALIPHLAHRRRLAALRRSSSLSTRPTRCGRICSRIARRNTTATRVGVGLLAIAVLASLLASGSSATLAPPASGLRVSMLDVGQGDAILLQPAGAPAVLVDGGPPGGGLSALLREAGVPRLGAAIVTHRQSDHAGGIRELLGQMPVGRVLFAAPDRRTLAAAAKAGIAVRRVVRGTELRSGPLRIEVLWPPTELLAGRRGGEDPNRLAIVALARWRNFSMLLSADAEAEATPLDPGPLDVLKVAHHGSDDSGLAELLDRTRPRLALISVGDGNPFGHPTAATLSTLAAHRVRTLRTDRDGTVVLEVGRASISVRDGS